MHNDTDNASHLMAAVAAAPRDPNCRWVLADFLSEQGDPRGEFLQLQLNIARQQFTATMRARADELWAAHADEWFRELEPFLADFRVEAGFPVEGWLARGLTVEGLQAAFSLPAFVTLTRLHGPIALVAEALAAPSMTALNSVSVRSSREFALVAERAVPGRLKRLELAIPLSRTLARGVLEADSLRALESLVVTTEQDMRFPNEGAAALQVLAKHPSLASVEFVVRDLLIPRLAQLWPETRWRRLVVAIPAGFQVCCDRRCVLERDADGATTVQFDGLTRSALRQLRVMVPQGTTRVVMFPVRNDDDGTTREALLREYEGLGPVVY